MTSHQAMQQAREAMQLAIRLLESDCPGMARDGLLTAWTNLEAALSQPSEEARDAARWRFFDANAQSTVEGGMKFAQWLQFDAVMKYGSRAAAVDMAMAHAQEQNL